MEDHALACEGIAQANRKGILRLLAVTTLLVTAFVLHSPSAHADNPSITFSLGSDHCMDGCRTMSSLPVKAGDATTGSWSFAIGCARCDDRTGITHWNGGITFAVPSAVVS